MQQEQLQGRLAEVLSSTEVKKEVSYADTALLDLVPKLPPFEGGKKYVSPIWLRPIAEALDMVIEPRKDIEFFCATAPRGHGKSILVNAAIIKHLCKHPTEMIYLYTNNDESAMVRSRDIRRVVENLGMKFRDDANTVREWQLTSGGGLSVCSMTAVKHGRHGRLIIIDDPFKNRQEARNATIRKRILSIIENDLIPILNPDGALIIIHARQHPDDAIGHYSKLGWPYIKLRAIETDENGVEYAIWPDESGWPLEGKGKLLEKRRHNPLDFETQYQGEPTVKEGVVFRDVYRYPAGKIPRDGKFRIAYGIDCAYSDLSQRRGDWSVCIKMMQVYGKKREEDTFYVLDVYRTQKNAPEFLKDIERIWRQDRGPMLWYYGGAEKGAFEFMKVSFPNLKGVPVGSKAKYARAQPVATAWNQGRVLVPSTWTDEFLITHEEPEWVQAFLDEIAMFTGTDDGVGDDQVDALGAAFDQLDYGPNLSSIKQLNGFGAGQNRFCDLPGRGFG